ncbi:hypothetical protein [Maribacter sp. 2304DJ31-5]|uniref:hypothetical protein n=1 Tax=Maribacter sp. 2304DJ31-5 TaxID=3386273 RepID=UPI0039BD48C8
MRKLSLICLAAFLLAMGSIFANDTEGVKPDGDLSVQISKMLSENSFSGQEIGLTAQVRFTLNNKGEIVVLSVDTKFAKLERFIKSRLNYQKVEISEIEEGRLYVFPMRISA